MSTLTEDIATILQDNTFGTIGTDIFVLEDAPNRPDAMIMIEEYGTSQPDIPRVEMEYPLVKIVVRDSRGKKQDCLNRMKQIRAFLRLIANYEVNDSKYLFIDHYAGPDSLGVDETMRPSSVIYFRCCRQDLPI